MSKKIFNILNIINSKNNNNNIYFFNRYQKKKRNIVLYYSNFNFWTKFVKLPLTFWHVLSRVWQSFDRDTILYIYEGYKNNTKWTTILLLIPSCKNTLLLLQKKKNNLCINEIQGRKNIALKVVLSIAWVTQINKFLYIQTVPNFCNTKTFHVYTPNTFLWKYNLNLLLIDIKIGTHCI